MSDLITRAPQETTEEIASIVSLLTTIADCDKLVLDTLNAVLLELKMQSQLLNEGLNARVDLDYTRMELAMDLTRVGATANAY